MASETKSRMNTLKEYWKHLASWDNTRHSVSALVGINIVSMYLMLTDATPLNLTLYTILLFYIPLSSCGQWILKNAQRQFGWGTVTTTEEEEPSSATMSEVSFMIEETKNKLSVLKKFRSDTPGFFCASLSSFFLVLTFIAPYLTLLQSIWLMLMGSLLLPLGLKHLKEKYPELSEISKKVQNMMLVILDDLLKKAKVQISKGQQVVLEKGKLGLKATEVYARKAKETVLEYTSLIGAKKVNQDDSPTQEVTAQSPNEEDARCKEKGADLLKDINGNIEQVAIAS